MDSKGGADRDMDPKGGAFNLSAPPCDPSTQLKGAKRVPPPQAPKSWGAPTGAGVPGPFRLRAFNFSAPPCDPSTQLKGAKKVPPSPGSQELGGPYRGGGTGSF